MTLSVDAVCAMTVLPARPYGKGLGTRVRRGARFCSVLVIEVGLPGQAGDRRACTTEVTMVTIVSGMTNQSITRENGLRASCSVAARIR